MFAKDRRNNFLRRTKATAPPVTTDSDSAPATTTSTGTSTDTAATDPETLTTGTARRGPGKFRPRKGGNRVDASARPAPNVKRSERPRSFVRRRLGGANATTSTTTAPVSTSSTATRRPFRVASRRRPPSTTTTTTTTEAPETETPAPTSSEEYLQDIDDTEEDTTLEPTVSAPRTTKVQRRPLVNLKDEVSDLNPSATNEDERKRQSKKYSASFKQNQLDEVLRLKAKSQETDDTTERKTTPFEELNSETAVAIAAHQLFAAPLPSIPSYDDDETTRKPPKVTTQYYTNGETEPYTGSRKTVYFEDFSSTPVYKSSTQDYVASSPTYSGISDDFDTPRGLSVDFDTPKAPSTTSFTIPKSTYSTSTFAAKELLRPAVPEPTIINTGLSGVAPTNVLARGSTTYSTNGLPRQSPTDAGYSASPRDSSRGSTTEAGYRGSIGYSGLPSESPRGSSTDAGYSGSTNGAYRGAQVYSGLPRETSSEYSSVPVVSSTPRFASTSKKLIPVPVEDYAFSTSAYSAASPEPAYFTREYLLESPVTKTYDDEYQYLSPITTPITTTRKPFRKKIMRKISTTIRPTTPVPSSTTARPAPRRVPAKTPKPFEKVSPAPGRTYRPIDNYDYYDDSEEKVAEKYMEGTKVVVHAKGIIECLDIGNFPHPTSCKKFISCSRQETGALIGWEYICPKGLSFDPVGGICNWSAGLGCDEKDV